MDPDRLAGYEAAFIALDAAVEADADGDVQQAKALRTRRWRSCARQSGTSRPPGCARRQSANTTGRRCPTTSPTNKNPSTCRGFLTRIL